MDKERQSRKRDRNAARSDSESSGRTPSRRRSQRQHRSRESRRRERSSHAKRRRHTPSKSKSRRRSVDRRTRQSRERATERSASPLNSAGTSTSSTKMDSNIILSTFKDLLQTMKTEGNSERYPTLNVIPEFDPLKRNQSINMWITKVNECAMIYNWSERQTIHYALPKLTGLAQKWYQGLPSLLFSWDEWQNKLKLAFPSEENYGQLLTEMLACKARFGDSLEEYFYEKTTLLNRCNIFGKNAIDCILFGIDDRSVRTSAEAAQFIDPDKLLVYLRNVKSSRKSDKPNMPMPASISENKRSKTFKSNQNTSEPKLNMKCYNCDEDGHPYYKCKQPIKRCDFCHKVGHLENNCQIKKPKDKTVLRISKEQDNDLKYFKTSKVNGMDLDCFIDFGSQCTMLQESVARKLIATWSMNDLPTLRGFGDSVVNCLGKCDVEIEVDSAKASVEALIVPDHLLRVPLLLGQTFTEQAHVVVYKTNQLLNITTKSNNNFVLLRTCNPELIKGFTEISIKSTPVYTGDIFIEPSLCQKPGQEYEIIQSVVKLENGLGHVVLKGLVSSGFNMDQNTLLIRASPLHELKTYHVNRIESNVGHNNHVSRIEKDMITANDNLNENDSEKLTEFLNSFRDCFAFSISELGCVKETEMEIKLNDPTPVVYRPYRMAHSEREIVRDMIQELEESDIIRPSSSDYASPILLVKKKTGDYRLCIDFRALNKKTVKEHYPMPRIDDQLDNLSGFKYYTTLDLASGYYQIPMTDASKHLTAFITPDGHYEFNRMPFGLVNAPSTFQKTINSILGNARFKKAFAYMDDVIIPSKTVEEGFEKLRETLDLFRNSGLTLKLSKCNFFMESIDYLGFEVSQQGIRPGKRKIEAVEAFPRPTDQHKLRQFIGLASFFRRFIKSFSVIARPLTMLLKKDCAWYWDELQENAFVKLKEELVKRPILSFYNPTYETQVHTDASKVGIAGILLQRPSKSSSFSAVAYYSRQTSPEEAKFTSYDLETLAVVTSLQRFRVYLLGIHFTVVTDCNSLRATFEKKDMLPRVARWWGVIQEYDLSIVYKPGVTMSHVDALSRNPIQSNINCQEVRCVDANWIATVQHSDSELQRMVEILNDEESENIAEIKNNFVIKRGLLYRKTPDGDRWVVPKGVRWQLLKANHDDIGHFSFDKTYEKIKNNYWFAKMRRFIKKYVESCLECAYAKVPAGKRAGELHPIEKTDHPFHTLHIDHLGPFIRSKRKNCYLLLVIDAFTKFIILVPVKSTKTVHSIRVLKNYFHTFGVPKRLISDRGSSFTAKRFQEFLRSLGVKHVMNAVATPRANGQIERYNRTVLSALTATNHGKPENIWDESVSEIQWGLNNTINKGTGKTPAQALFGLNLTGTSDSLIHLNIETEVLEPEENVQDIRDEISEHIKKNQLKQKENFDKKRKKVNYKVGELVRIEREISSTGKSRKLVPKLRGPYRITNVLDNDRYMVEDTPLSRKGNRSFSGVFSVDKIHPWLVFNRTTDESQSGDSDSE